MRFTVRFTAPGVGLRRGLGPRARIGLVLRI